MDILRQNQHISTSKHPSNAKKYNIVNTICIGGFVITWFMLLYSLFDNGHSKVETNLVESAPETKNIPVLDSRNLRQMDYDENVRLPLPQRYPLEEKIIDPPPLAEIERNMTLYLTTLHKKYAAVAGPQVTGLMVWEIFLDVTKKMPMVWDEQNKHRFPKPRNDDSIFVSLGTYRDPFCPMTIKSLYANAKHPEKVFTGLFQQNCFGPTCRTGVLVGGKVEDAGPDPDCYKLFCESPEGIQSQACTNGNVRLFNVNESESLGPYMARYLGGGSLKSFLFNNFTPWTSIICV